jgi:hypothetical protein
VIKRYCDGCNQEITRNYVIEQFNPSIRLNDTLVTLEVTIAINDLWNAGDLCLDCLKQCIRTGVEKKSDVKAST